MEENVRIELDKFKTSYIAEKVFNLKRGDDEYNNVVKKITRYVSGKQQPNNETLSLFYKFIKQQAKDLTYCDWVVTNVY